MQSNKYLSLVFLLISNLTNGLRLHQFLETKTTEAKAAGKVVILDGIQRLIVNSFKKYVEG